MYGLLVLEFWDVIDEPNPLPGSTVGAEVLKKFFSIVI
jgi:hypothetical protein